MATKTSQKKSKLLHPFDLAKAIELLKRRFVKYSAVRTILKLQDISPGAGWEALNEKVVSGLEDADALVVAVADLYRVSLLLGSRWVRVLHDPEFDWTGAFDSAVHLAVPTSVFSPSYPLPLTQFQLKTLPLNEPILVEVRKLSDDELALIFCTVRQHEDVVDLDAAKIPASMASTFGTFDRLVGINQIHTQCFDTFVLKRKLQRLEIRIDGLGGPSHDQAHEFSAVLFNYLTPLVPIFSELMNASVNFFPAIKEIYADPRAGVVERLWFETHTGSVKKESMRRSGSDLRTELYHVNGSAGLKEPIGPYHLKVMFEKITAVDNKISITLPGRLRDLASTTPTLNTALFEGCITASEFDHAVNKLISHC